jgi:hypothetical protein
MTPGMSVLIWIGFDSEVVFAVEPLRRIRDSDETSSATIKTAHKALLFLVSSRFFVAAIPRLLYKSRDYDITLMLERTVPALEQHKTELPRFTDASSAGIVWSRKTLT